MSLIISCFYSIKVCCIFYLCFSKYTSFVVLPSTCSTTSYCRCISGSYTTKHSSCISQSEHPILKSIIHSSTLPPFKCRKFLSFLVWLLVDHSHKLEQQFIKNLFCQSISPLFFSTIIPASTKVAHE